MNHGRSVLAIVLTHNAPGALRACLQAICAQTVPPSEVLVVDNASAPPASETIEALRPRAVPIASLRLPDNRGPAGGHAVGLEQFLQSGRDLAWVFDDDCVPEPTCLARLLAPEQEADAASPAVVFPRQVDRHGTVQDYPAWFGVLLPREVVQRVGLPLEALFWWTEDTEYLQWRIPRAGFPVRRQPAARVIHHGVRQGAHKPGWKYYYETRNSVYYRTYVQHGRRLHRLVPYFARTVLRICLREDRRVKKLGLLGLGAYHGILGRLGKRVPVPGEAAVREPRAPGVLQ